VYDPQVGWTITFRNGEVRTINDVTTPSPGVVLVEWSGSAISSGTTNPCFPITLASADYATAVKPTARIKPNNDLVSLGQYMEIYTGGPTLPDDLGHIHMKGHTGNTELFLGTDSNFVSTKEAGVTPGHVTMRSETEIKVIETAIRTTRNGNTFISNYGDSANYNYVRDALGDLTHDCVTADTDGNYYIGGEHAGASSDVMISKFSKDGELLWSQYAGSSTPSWDPQGIAYDSVNDRVAIISQSDYERDYDYVRLTEFNSDGSITASVDFYDTDYNIYGSDIKRHPTLGWVIVGDSYAEDLASAALSPQTGSGVGVLVLDAAATTARGLLMDYNDNRWRLSGNNVTGKQSLLTAIGLFKGLTPVNVTVANPAAAGAVIDVRINYQGGTYYGIDAVTTAGTNYTTGDTVKVLGSQLGGTDGTNDVTFTIVDNGSGGINGSNNTSGTPSITNITLNMAEIGYTTDNFSTGSYTVYFRLDQRPIVLTSTWKKYLETANDQDGNGYARCIDIDADDNIYVGGYIDSSLNSSNGGGFIWKLNTQGTTQWLMGTDLPWEISSLAVSSTDSLIHTVSQGMGTYLTKFNSATGAVLVNYYPTDAGLAYSYNDPKIDTALDDQGDEYVYVSFPNFSAAWTNYTGFAVQKFTLDLVPVWSRYMELIDDITFYNNYGDQYQHFALTPTQAVAVGYAYTLGSQNYDAQLWSMSITDNFEVSDGTTTNRIVTGVQELQWTEESATTTSLTTVGITVKTSSAVNATSSTPLGWNRYNFQNRILNGNTSVKGLVGVDNIKFTEGGDLDHNPSDIPQSTQNVWIGDGIGGWTATLTLADRGKFIKNKVSPDIGDVQDLIIYVPPVDDAPFPIGSVITLINLDNTDTYEIEVVPSNFGENVAAARIYCSGQNNYSTWAFKGVQTATLMKIAPNDWLLTCNDPRNTD
jgi:hypothetical protein